jgi:hypothetical protein
MVTYGLYHQGELAKHSVGAQAKKIRACVIVQNDVENRYSLLTVVMPLLQLPARKNENSYFFCPLPSAFCLIFSLDVRKSTTTPIASQTAAIYTCRRMAGS